MPSMRGMRALSAGVLGLLALLVFAYPGKAQHNDTPQYLEEASKNLRPLLATARTEGYQLEKGLTFAGGWIDKGEKWTGMLRVDLVGGKSYRFVGAGDFDATDVDLRITDQDGKELKADTSTSKTATVDFVPQVGAKYTIEMRVYASQNNVPCVCMMSILSK